MNQVTSSSKTLSSSSLDSSVVDEDLDLMLFKARRLRRSALFFMVCNWTSKPESWKVYSLDNLRYIASSDALCIRRLKCSYPSITISKSGGVEDFIESIHISMFFPKLLQLCSAIDFFSKRCGLLKTWKRVPNPIPRGVSSKPLPGGIY